MAESGWRDVRAGGVKHALQGPWLLDSGRGTIRIMADGSSIEWTDATWNPVTGCTKISPGCDHCYAERFSERFRGVAGHPFENGFDLTLRPERLSQPLRWRQPRMIFVNSMSDLFHKEVPKEFIGHVFKIMEKANWHTFQVLTKRSSLMRNFLKSRYGTAPGPAHMWFGVSIEDGTKLSRVRHLQQAPAGVRFLSIEPLIGPVGNLDLSGIDWVIAGGESGPGARPMEKAWAQSIRDQCKAAGVAFFFKQWGVFARSQEAESSTGGSGTNYRSRTVPMR
jgi:protein gp37